jgi:hypothetical protein
MGEARCWLKLGGGPSAISAGWWDLNQLSADSIVAQDELISDLVHTDSLRYVDVRRLSTLRRILRYVEFHAT